MVYRTYISDSLYYQAEQKKITVRYYDLLYGKKKENKTAKEIIADVVRSTGLKLVGGN